MTALASASAIIDDLVESGSFLRTQVSACDYGILNKTTGCAVILRPSTATFVPHAAYGGGSIDTWGFIAECYIRHMKDPEVSLKNVIQMYDVIKTAVSSGSNANTIILTTKVNSISHNPNVFFTAGGADFLLVTANITSMEDP